MAGKPRKASSQLNVRVAPELRRRLEKAALESGNSLNREIEIRLERSLAEEAATVQRTDDMHVMFYDRALHGMAVLIVSAMHWAGSRAAGLDDPLGYLRATEAVNVILAALAPPAKIEASEQIKQRAKLLSKLTKDGAEIDPIKLEKDRARTFAEVTTQEIIEDIALARAGHMVGSQERVDQVRADLGPLVDRLNEYAKTHDYAKRYPVVSETTPGDTE